MAREPDRRRPHTGPVPKNYFKRWKSRKYGEVVYLRARERIFAENFAAGFLAIAPVLMSASNHRTKIVLRRLAMDSVANSPYRCRDEAALNRQAIYLMNMPRVQVEIDKIMSRHGMSKERMAARLAEIMEGKAITETKTYSRDKENGIEFVSGRVTQTNSVSDSLRAIDITIRATTGYAATNAKVTINNDMTAMFDPQTFDQTPEIATDPKLALEAQQQDQKNESEVEDDDDDEDEDEYCDVCEAAGKDECDCEYDEDEE